MGHFFLNATTVLPAREGHWLSFSFYEELSLATILFFHSIDLICQENGTFYNYPRAKKVCLSLLAV